MTVKAYGMVTFMSGYDGTITFFLTIVSMNGQQASDIPWGPIDPNASDITINSDLRAFVKQYAIDNLNTTFDVGDKVRLIHRLDILT